MTTPPRAPGVSGLLFWTIKVLVLLWNRWKRTSVMRLTFPSVRRQAEPYGSMDPDSLTLVFEQFFVMEPVFWLLKHREEFPEAERAPSITTTSTVNMNCGLFAGAGPRFACRRWRPNTTSRSWSCDVENGRDSVSRPRSLKNIRGSLFQSVLWLSGHNRDTGHSSYCVGAVALLCSGSFNTFLTFWSLKL